MKALNHKELISFCSQLSMILRAGISVTEGIWIMKEDLPSGEGRSVLESLYEKLERTGVLHLSMRETGVFPDYVCNMTEIGEQSGRLDEVMDGLTGYYEREEDISQNIKSALTYPSLMLGLMTAVVWILVIKVMPVFQNVFEQLGGGLSGISLGILNLGMILSRYSFVLILLLIVILMAAGYLIFSTKGRDTFRRFVENSRMFGNLTEKMACARIAGGMHLCIRSGLDLDQSLEMAERLLSHDGVKAKVEICRRRLMEGESFETAMEASHLFAGVYGKMIAIGIRTGAADQVMEKIAKQYEEEVSERLTGGVAMIEPVLVAILSVVVGLILLSVMLPLLGIISNLG